MPYLFLLYIIAYLDRVNVGYAALGMTNDLGFSPEVYGFGAGVFFVGYFLLEIPGTILVERWSATLEDGELSFEADSGSLKVLEGHGGISSLGDEEKAAIKQTIDEEILKGTPITYRSGELTLNGVTRPVEYRFENGEPQHRVAPAGVGNGALEDGWP